MGSIAPPRPRTRHPGPEPGPALFLVAAMEKMPCVYILAKASHSTLLCGCDFRPPPDVFGSIEKASFGTLRSVMESSVVWFEPHETVESAIIREKRIKRWSRAWKYELIHARNPTWRDLAEDFGFPALPPK